MDYLKRLKCNERICYFILSTTVHRRRAAQQRTRKLKVFFVKEDFFQQEIYITNKRNTSQIKIENERASVRRMNATNKNACIYFKRDESLL